MFPYSQEAERLVEEGRKASGANAPCNAAHQDGQEQGSPVHVAVPLPIVRYQRGLKAAQEF